MKSEEDISEATERVRRRVQSEANQTGALAEPLVVIQWLIYRSLIQEAHLYALLDQLSTGKIDHAEMQKRFVDHANRIVTELQFKRGTGKLVTPGKRGN